MTCPFTQTYAADAASPTCQAFWVQSIWAPHVAHGSDRRSVFSTTVTRLPKLHELSNACAAATRSCTADASFVCSVASIFPSAVQSMRQHVTALWEPVRSCLFAELSTSKRSTGAGALESVGLSKHPHAV